MMRVNLCQNNCEIWIYLEIFTHCNPGIEIYSGILWFLFGETNWIPHIPVNLIKIMTDVKHTYFQICQSDADNICGELIQQYY